MIPFPVEPLHALMGRSVSATVATDKQPFSHDYQAAYPLPCGRQPQPSHHFIPLQATAADVPRGLGPVPLGARLARPGACVSFLVTLYSLAAQSWP